MLPLLLTLQVVAQHDALRYDITLIPSDTGTHLLGEVETVWRLASSEPVVVRLDSSMRVVRVMVDGRPNTRVARTMYARSVEDVLVPHQKRAGDSITTRIRYHGFARVGERGLGARLGRDHRDRPSFVAGPGEDAQPFWLPVPRGAAVDRTVAAFHIQVPVAQRAIGPGGLTRVDTLPYGEAVWHYRLDVPVPIAALAAASGPYAVRTVGDRCGRGCERVEVWRYQGGSPEGSAMERAPGMVRFMADRAGPYPFGRLAHVEANVPRPVPAAGLVLHPRHSLAGDLRGPESWILERGTIAQWFGILLVSAPEDGWITHGLADYFQHLPDSALARWLDGRISDPGGPPVGLTFHRLRESVGDSAFFRGVARAVEEHRDRLVTHRSFLDVMDAVAGRELDLTRPW